MSNMPWVKLYTEMLDDFKLLDLEDAVKWRFVQLILLAGECDEDGYIVAGGDAIDLKKIAKRLRCDYEQLRDEVSQLSAAGLISQDESTGALYVVKFRDRQGRPQSEKREQWRDRQRRYREKESSVTEESRRSHASRVEESRVDKINTEKYPATTSVFTSVTGMVVIPGKNRDDDMDKLNALIAKHRDNVVDVLKPYYQAWLDRKYSKVNTGWLDWAIAEQIPKQKEIPKNDDDPGAILRARGYTPA